MNSMNKGGIIMKNELKLKRCLRCGNLVRASLNSPVICCGEKMVDIVANSEDASFEKHVPNYERVEDEVYVTVNHVMEKDHYIEWLCLVADNKEYFVKLYPEQEAAARFPYIKGSTLYAYCNKHGLWKTDVE